MTSNWNDVKTRKELRRLALELNPYVSQVGNTNPRMFRLSTAVEVLGWEKAEADYPEVSRLLGRLGALVGEKDREIERLKGVADRFVDEIVEREHGILGLKAEIVDQMAELSGLRARIEKALALIDERDDRGFRTTFLVDLVDQVRADLTGESEGK